MLKKLVILTDNFGLNFSGGATATCRIFEQLAPDFSEIIVIGKQEGLHPFKELIFLEYRTPLQAVRHLKSLASAQSLFYGDFYMAYYFILAGVPYYFTYHDNWPEQARLDWRNQLRGLFYIPLYRWIIRKANWVITVSNFKYQFISAISPRTSVIRNGINAPLLKDSCLSVIPGARVRLVMLGNIDDRKFAWAIPLFEKIAAWQENSLLQIDIYGHPNKQKLVEELRRFSFVNFKGFSNDIDFRDYHLFLSTSKMENLSIAVCEALMNFTPVICFDVGGLKEVVEDRKTGCLVNPGDVELMYDLIIQFSTGQLTFDFSQQDLSEYDWRFAAKAYLEILGLT